MKRHLFLLLTAATLLWSPASHAAGELGENGGANENPHNLSSGNTEVGNIKKALTETQICIFCHTPHGGSPMAPLWGRPAPQTMTSFPLRSGLGIANAGIVNTTLYDSAHSTSGAYPNGTSKLCLSCHDGVTAMGVLLGGSPAIDMEIGGEYAVEVVLSTSHPISFVYNSTVETYLGASYNVPSLTSGYIDSDSRVQCTSCHQPHLDTRGTGANLPFWRYGTGNPASDYDPVCQACHTSTPTTYTIPNSHTH